MNQKYNIVKKLSQFFFILMVCFLGLPLNESRAAPEKSGLFGSYETKSLQMIAFKKWNSMLARVRADQKTPVLSPEKCRKTIDQICYMAAWKALLARLEDSSTDKQIAQINTQMNKAPYITDIINWGVPDYWASLRQFFKKDGDCEDYAIAKYLSLKALGFDVDKMRVAVVQDTNLDVPHAVLVVSNKGKRWILDNQISQVVSEKAVLHYRPYYSINENAWWLHRM